MAHLLADHSTGRWQCFYKRATFVLCTANILVGLCMLHAALAPIHHDSSSSSVARRADGVSLKGIRVTQTRPTAEELERIETSNRLRRELLPVQLIERVKEIRKETELEINRSRSINLARQKVALELAQRLRNLKRNKGQYIRLGALQGWNTTKLEKTNSVPEEIRGGEEKVADPRVTILLDGSSEEQKSGSGQPSEGVDVEKLV